MEPLIEHADSEWWWQQTVESWLISGNRERAEKAGAGVVRVAGKPKLVEQCWQEFVQGVSFPLLIERVAILGDGHG
jgi:hypothetical protein